jgi:hypothetical protein
MPLLEITLKSDLRKHYDSLKSKPQAIVDVLTTRLNIMLFQLQRHIITEKLSGQVLHRRSGALANAVRVVSARVEGATIRGGVTAAGSPASLYGRVHETGGNRAYEIMSVKSRALAFMMDGRMRFFSRVNHPAAMARPFMAPSLQENAERIRAELQSALDEELAKD